MKCSHCGHDMEESELPELDDDLEVGNEVLDELIGAMDSRFMDKLPQKDGKMSIEVLKIKPKKRDE